MRINTSNGFEPWRTIGYLISVFWLTLISTGCATNNAVPAVSDVCPLPETTTELSNLITSRLKGCVVYSDIYDNAEHLLKDVRVVLFSGSADSPNMIFWEETDSDGQFEFSGIPSGIYTLRTCLEGWDAVQMKVTILPDAPSEQLILKISPS